MSRDIEKDKKQISYQEYLVFVDSKKIRGKDVSMYSQLKFLRQCSVRYF